MALIDKLNNLGNAIRAKTGTTEKMTLDEMVTAVKGISVLPTYDEFEDSSVEVAVSLNLPTTTEIKDRAFEYDEVLTNITMPNVTSIGKFAFYNCNGLTLITLPKNLVSIGESAFAKCEGLKRIEIPSNVKFIGSKAFNARRLETITFKGTPTSIASDAFMGRDIAGFFGARTINVPWAEGEVANAPWGATAATINYNYTGG